MDAKQYYRENRERILRQRAERYLNDEAYREAIKQRARLSSEEKKISRRDDPQTVKFLRGQERFFKLMDLPGILGRDYSVIRSWILNGTIPEPICTTSNGRKVYAWSQVQTMAFVIKSVQSGIFHLTYPQLKTIFNQRWRKKFSMPGILMDLKNMKRTDNDKGKPASVVVRRPPARAARIHKGGRPDGSTKYETPTQESSKPGSSKGESHERGQRKVRRSHKGPQVRGIALHPWGGNKGSLRRPALVRVDC